jgi:hypothetical protein
MHDPAQGVRTMADHDHHVADVAEERHGEQMLQQGPALDSDQGLRRAHARRLPG